MPKGPIGKMKKGLDMKNPTRYASNNGKTTPPAKPQALATKDNVKI